jgi:hypothetical protein
VGEFTGKKEEGEKVEQKASAAMIYECACARRALAHFLELSIIASVEPI